MTRRRVLQHQFAVAWGHVLLAMGPDLTAEEWARQIGCSPGTVLRMCREHGLRTRGMR